MKFFNLNTVLAFGSFGHILIWLGKVTVQNPLCHLECKIFTFRTLCKLSAVDLCVETEGIWTREQERGCGIDKYLPDLKAIEGTPFLVS